MLCENTLFGKRDKIEVAIARIKEFEPMAVNMHPSGYHVCISGGKDSSVIQELCLMAGARCEFVHSHTSVDLPETVYFMRREIERLKGLGAALRVEFPRYEDGRQKTMWSLIAEHGLPLRGKRFCCQHLKEYAGRGRYRVTGVRWAESSKRKTARCLHESFASNKAKRITLNNDNEMRRRLNELCVRKGSFILNPIIDWTDGDVWDFIKGRGIPCNPLYDNGFRRVGCVGCPMGDPKKELEKHPKYRDAYFRAAKKFLERRAEKGLSYRGVMESPEKYFEWWLKGRRYEADDPVFAEWEEEL